MIVLCPALLIVLKLILRVAANTCSPENPALKQVQHIVQLSVAVNAEELQQDADIRQYDQFFSRLLFCRFLQMPSADLLRTFGVSQHASLRHQV